MEEYDVCIIGSGPAAHTAAIYTSRANLNTILYEGFMANGIAPGGQLTTTSEIENFPGFPDGIQGLEFCQKLRDQSSKFGTKIITETVKNVEKLENNTFNIYSEDEYNCNAKAVIVATGASARKLDFVGSDKYWNNGISACAVCDGAMPIFRNKPIAVVGGGDSAMEEATYLTKYASKVYIIHRKDTFNASKIMQDRVFNNNKIEIIWNHTIHAAEGDSLLQQLILNNVNTNEKTTIQVNGLFYAIGHIPASKFISDLVKVDKNGYIITFPNSTETNVDGIFAAGDVQDHQWRQAITAAGSGCMAALEVERYLNRIKN